ncbi:MAG: hypothetical protein ACRD21_02240, partial [Vicinamibacteria bacterium]
VFLSTFFLVGAASAQAPSVNHLIPPKNEEAKRESARDVAVLEQTIDRVGRAFEEGSPEELDSLLSDQKIHLSLKARGEEAGYYGRSQVKFIFARLFRERKTDSFTYDPREIEVSGEKSAQFRAKWNYMVLDADEVVTEHLRFELERGARGIWRISEIRTQAR